MFVFFPARQRIFFWLGSNLKISKKEIKIKTISRKADLLLDSRALGALDSIAKQVTAITTGAFHSVLGDCKGGGDKEKKKRFNKERQATSDNLGAGRCQTQ